MKRLAVIRNAKDWREQLDLAEDKEPRTEFDPLFKEAKLALFLARKPVGIEGEARLARIGAYFSEIFERRDSNTLDQMSRALRTWRRHKPARTDADIIRVTLIALHGMFQPGGPKRKLVDGKIVDVGTWSNIFTRDVMQNIERHGVKITSENRDRIRREIQRQAKKLNIPLDSTPGRPRKKITGQKRTQKP